MKILGYIIAGIALIAVLILGVGAALPKHHTAIVRAHYRVAPDRIYETITDVASAARWRSGLDSVRIESAQPLRWTEYAEWGSMTYVMDEATAPSRIVNRLADESDGFGGTWTFDIAPDRNGSVVTITENGVVYNPLFRFMSRFMYGHYTGLETFAHDLGRHFNQDVTAEHLKN